MKGLEESTNKSPVAPSTPKKKQKIKMLEDLKEAFVIIQDSLRPVPLNDLDCCLIKIREMKNQEGRRKEGEGQKGSKKNILVLPFSQFKINLYSYVAINRKDECKILMRKG